MATLQLPEGYTVRKVGNGLKVVPMRKRKVAIVEEKAMLKAVRSTYGKQQIFDWQESLKDTVLANREAVFTPEEMYAALESVVQGDDYFESKSEISVASSSSVFENSPNSPSEDWRKLQARICRLV